MSSALDSLGISTGPSQNVATISQPDINVLTTSSVTHGSHHSLFAPGNLPPISLDLLPGPAPRTLRPRPHLSHNRLRMSSISSLGIKREATSASPDVRALKRLRTEGSFSMSTSRASTPSIPDFVLSASAMPLPRGGSFSSHFSPSLPPTPRKSHGARLRSMTPLLSPMDEAFASFDAALRSRTCTPVPGDFRYAPESARYHMQPQPRATIDFSLPQDDTEHTTCPLSWSTNHILAFPRGNRVYLKNVYSSVDDVGYTFKPMKKHGILRLLDFASETPHILALGTANGNIELWDIEARKMTQSWTATGLTRFQWNEGRILAVGDEKGSIQYYDTRIDDRKEMKMKKGKVTRHEAAITSLSWNRRDPRYLATGARDGVVYFWDNRQDAPLNMGEMVQRRRKMQHDNPVSTMEWCNSKTLATASNAPDDTSVLRVWTMDRDSENIERHEYDASIVGIHFSSCREITLAHGPGKTTSHPSMLAAPITSPASNTLAAYAMPYFKEAKTLNTYAGTGTDASPIIGSVLDRTGTKLILAVGGDENKLKLWDVWGKKTMPAPEPISVHGSLSRQNSFSSLSRRGSLIIR